ncbi:MAG TPA: ABC transporter substrate-binding protein [Acidimicrobiia bacterium]|nr:ABC transporter substrate-binding protein [Acidimicrobiia bacterium]
MQPTRRFMWLLMVMALVVAACGTAADTTTTTAADAEPPTTEAPEPGTTEATEPDPEEPITEEPIVIGAAIDQTGFMAPFDGPAIVAAQIKVDEINAAGGVNGSQLELRVVDTQLDPEQTTSAAIDMLDAGAAVLLVTCDVDFATPAVQEALNAQVLAVAPCIGTDQMGPVRFGDQGELAFSFGNVAQDEGAVMAEFAIDQGWMNAAVAKDNLIVYFQNVVDAFTARYEELGGTVSIQEEFTNGDGTIGSVVSTVANSGVDVIVTSTAFDDMPALAQGVRSLGDDTPMLCSWSCDGAYWIPEDLSNFYLVTFASVFGDDPSSEVNDLIAAMEEVTGQPPATGGFITGAATIEAIAAAIMETGGTDGPTLAAHLLTLDDFPTITGPISFSADFHTVFGREYRVLVVQDGQHSLVETRQATSPADIG